MSTGARRRRFGSVAVTFSRPGAFSAWCGGRREGWGMGEGRQAGRALESAESPCPQAGGMAETPSAAPSQQAGRSRRRKCRCLARVN